MRRILRMFLATMALSAALDAVAAEDAKASTSKREVARVTMTPAQGASLSLLSANLIAMGDRTRIAVTLARVPDGLADPGLVVTLYKGACGDTARTTVRSISGKAAQSTDPYGGGVAAGTAGGVRFDGTVTIALSTMRGTPHSISLVTGAVDGSRQLACGDIR